MTIFIKGLIAMATAMATAGEELVADAKMSSREDTLAIIESLTLALLKEVASGADPSLSLVNAHTPHHACMRAIIMCSDLQGREKCGQR